MSGLLPGLFTGLGGFRADMTTSIASGRSPVTYMNKIPTSRGELERIKVTSEGGGSKTQESINVNLLIKRWGESNYHEQVFKGQPIFLQRSGNNMRHKPIVMNIRQVNSFLKAGYDAAIKVWSDKQRVVDANVLTSEEYDLLMSTPTESWEQFEFLKSMLRNKQNKDFHNIKYLYEAGMRERLTFFGYHRNPTNDLEFIEVSAAVYGTVEYVENCWSNAVHNGFKIGFVFKRIFDPLLNRYTHFAFDPRPWSKGVLPTTEQSMYEDITGHICRGYVFQIGTVDERTIHHLIEQDVVDESVGLVPTTRDRFFLSAEPGCLRITLCPRVEYPIPWFH